MLRLKAIVEQTGAWLVVASDAQKDVSGHLTNHTVSIVEQVSQISYMAALQSLTPVDPSIAAYLVFTSGSTGCPKGILIGHDSFCSALHHELHHFDVRQDSRVFDFASYSFDISLHNMLATLSAGACLCVPSESDRVGNATGAMAFMRATVVSLTTCVARLVLEATRVPTLQTLILAGEAVFSKDVDKWWGRVCVINAYGPAECTPISTINSTATDAFPAARIGTGEGSVTWVVDPEDRNMLLPPGVVGELLLEGPCLARCYLENAKKTSEAFIQDVPWLHAGTSTHAGRRGRLYKTGDLVCYHEDGSLTYMGRKDTQIKIRGQRVEIGEVEHHIRQLLPKNLDLQVAVDLATPQNRNAAALVVFASFGGLTKRGLTGDDAQSHRVASALVQVAEQLRGILPSHMVPTSYKLSDQLPLTATAKIDRRALRALDNTISGEDLTSLGIKPECKRLEISTRAKEHLKTLWSKVLRIEPSAISADKTFYQLGGNSIQAIHLVGAAREVGMTLEVADVYKHPRLTDLAKRLKASDGGLGHTANRLRGNGVVDQSMEAML
ncbi:nrps [Epichloe bromicola]|uniref:Nrps n=1 Tax=Epichloe bromicola TaxID=79588 RepID=A0ABQ0CXB9_9HYPO